MEQSPVDPFERYQKIQYLLEEGKHHPDISGPGLTGPRGSITRAAKKYVLKNGRLYYKCNGRERLVVMNVTERDEVLRECHDSSSGGGHYGYQTTVKKVIASYFWDEVRGDVQKWVAECRLCQSRLKVGVGTDAPLESRLKVGVGTGSPLESRLKVGVGTDAPLERRLTVGTADAPVESRLTVGTADAPLEVATDAPLEAPAVQEPWAVLGVELVGPLACTRDGNQFIMIVMDLFTRWLIAKPLCSASGPEVSQSIADILLDFGLVEKIVTDEGPEFENDLDRGVFDAFGVTQSITTASHPQWKGQNERISVKLKQKLCMYCNEEQDDWDAHLRSVVSAINCTPVRATRCSPYFAMFGRHPRRPGLVNMTGRHPSSSGLVNMTGPLAEEEELLLIGQLEDGMEQRLSDITAISGNISRNISVEKAKRKAERESRRRKRKMIGNDERESRKRKRRRIGKIGMSVLMLQGEET